MKILRFTPTTTPITQPVTKFGGQPTWIATPQWPFSRTTQKPMRFICQVELPPQIAHGSQEMAYIFMTEPDLGDERVDGTWEAEGGENAVVLQPADFEHLVVTKPLTTGPTLRRGRNESVGFMAHLRGYRGRRILEEIELAVTQIESDPADEDARLRSRIAGEPGWLQNEELPNGGPWDLIVQIDSSRDEFDVDFADAGVGYAFIRRDGRAARFIWQSL
jgi:hypothetical protein